MKQVKVQMSYFLIYSQGEFIVFIYLSPKMYHSHLTFKQGLESMSPGAGLCWLGETQSKQQNHNLCCHQELPTSLLQGSIVLNNHGAILMWLRAGQIWVFKELIVALTFKSYSFLKPRARPCDYKLKWIRQLDKYTHKEPDPLSSKRLHFVTYNL